MSVRVCYIERAERGHRIRRVRLVGQATQAIWPPEPSQGGPGATPASPAMIDATAAAAWISEQLAQTRDSHAVSMLCLDIDGAACSWLTSPSADEAVLNAVARGGTAHIADGTDTVRGNAAVDYYAPGVIDSTVQALTKPDDRGGDQADRGGAAPFLARRSKSPVAAPGSQRLAVLAMTDVPGRQLVDALDQANVPVESAASFWHAAAMAWDPGWAASPEGSAGDDPLRARLSAQANATIVIDPQGKLIWCWSHAGKLLVAGSMRLRMAAPAAVGEEVGVGDAPPPAAEEEHHAIFGVDEVTRLTAEWLSWCVQTGRAPVHITCVMTQRDPGMVAEFGQALGKLWPNSPIDAVMHEDPILATLTRLTDRLEQTPKTQEALTGATALVGLSTRRGREHRRLYTWSAFAIGACAVLVAAGAMQLRSMAARANAQTLDVAAKTAQMVKDYFPDARPGPGYTLLMATNDEVARLRGKAEPPKRSEPPLPVLEELEVISMVIGNNDFTLEQVDLEGSLKSVLKLNVYAESFAAAESLIPALNSIAGSHVDSWKGPKEFEIKLKPGKYGVNCTAQWIKPVEAKPGDAKPGDVKPDAGAKPAVKGAGA